MGRRLVALGAGGIESVSSFELHRHSCVARRSTRASDAATVTVAAVDGDGRALVELEGETLSVDGALVGERVSVRARRGRGRGQRRRAVLLEVLDASEARVQPACAHFGVCGGCRFQHMSARAQHALKQKQLLDALDANGGLAPDEILGPLTGPTTGYRRRARLGVKYVAKKGGTLVGFREHASPKVAELATCAVLDPRIGNALGALRRLIDRLAIRHRVPQLEVAMGDSDTALVVRHLERLSEHDRAVLEAFARERAWQIHLQPGGPESIEPLYPEAPVPLVYALPEFDLDLEFLPTDFVQINAVVNRELVRAAIDHLDLTPSSRVLDLFCGIGNFTLAAARRAASVTGVEGDAALVERARGNAGRNAIEHVEFFAADLTDCDARAPWWRSAPDRVLLDPPRTGAERVLEALGEPFPERIVYVSCNPRTFARDASVLVRRKGYRLARAGIVDMFPHTGHCESLAVFDRPGRPGSR